MWGKYSYGDPEIKFKHPDVNLSVGHFCSIGANFKAYLSNGFGHSTNFVSTYPFGYIHQAVFENKNKHLCDDKNRDIMIGNDVWFGENVVVMSGVTIGHGAVVANNSHVTKNVEPYTIVGGNPATFIKRRFTKEQIDKLLLIQWWDWEDSKINENLPLLYSENINDFINVHYKMKINWTTETTTTKGGSKKVKRLSKNKTSRIRITKT